MNFEHLEKRLLILEAKLDKLVDIQADIRVDLNEHIRRTEIAERRLDSIDQELKPVTDHVHFMQTTGKLIMKIGAIVGTIIGLAFTGIQIILKIVGRGS